MKNVIAKLKEFNLPSIKLHGKILTIAGSTLVGMAIIAAIFFYQSARIEAASEQERTASVHLSELARVQSAAESLSGAVQAFVVRPTEVGVERIERSIQATTELSSSGEVEEPFNSSLLQLVSIAERVWKNQTILGFSPSSGLGAEISASITKPRQVFENLGMSGIPVSDVLSAIFSLREAERQFMLTKDAASIAVFDSAFAGFEEALETVYLSSAQRKDIDISLRSYQEDFGAFVSATNDVRAGMTDLMFQMSKLSNLISERYKALNAAGATALQLLEHERNSLRTALVSTIVIVSVLVFGLALIVGRSIEVPIKCIEQVMRKISRGKYSVDVPYKDRSDEVGEMARAVEVFRENGLKISSMSQAERVTSQRRDAERAAMMEALQQSFGEVVTAAAEGDFSKTIDNEFSDPELNVLASGVNHLVKTVERGLSETGVVLAALADTDLRKRVGGEYKGAFADLKDDTNAVGDKLTGVIASLRDTSSGLKSATGEILAGANDLSSRTTQQAATIEETTSSMAILASKVNGNAALAQKGSENAHDVAESAEDGGAVMRQTTEAMKRISDSSGKISNIIGLIDDIAFQTNLLALNASVEAARAGDAGKGFAVVAVEVRRLAQSAASASSDVKKLIETSLEDVASGSLLVTHASEKLKSIQEAVHANTSLMSKIAQESRSQATSIEEVCEAVRQMDRLTQANAALVEQTNAAIEQTENQAHDLDELVSVFKLGPIDAHFQHANTKFTPTRANPTNIAKEKVTITSPQAALRSNGSSVVEAEWQNF